MEYQLVAPCYFGLERAAAFDFKRIGAKNVCISDGRIGFSGNEQVLAEANLWSRCTERILIRLGNFPAEDFDALFDGVFAIPFEEFLPADANFPVKGSSLSSQLSSVPACQKIVKKAVVERLKKGHGVQVLPEDGAEYRLRFSIRKNEAELFLDTSGTGLHKRGYRRVSGMAPLKETLAAGIADLAHVRRDSLVQDPFCGSGTLLIESALKAKNIAPGLQRKFAAEEFAFLPSNLFEKARQAAREQEKPDAEFRAFGSDIDPGIIQLAKTNARLAKVDRLCHFEQKDACHFKPKKEAILLANPPYGERMMSIADATALEKAFGNAVLSNRPNSVYILTSNEEFERNFGEKATKRRKMYNGMIPCQLYMYYGRFQTNTND